MKPGTCQKSQITVLYTEDPFRKIVFVVTPFQQLQPQILSKTNELFSKFILLKLTFKPVSVFRASVYETENLLSAFDCLSCHRVLNYSTPLCKNERRHGR